MKVTLTVPSTVKWVLRSISIGVIYFNYSYNLWELLGNRFEIGKGIQIVNQRDRIGYAVQAQESVPWCSSYVQRLWNARYGRTSILQKPTLNMNKHQVLTFLRLTNEYNISTWHLPSATFSDHIINFPDF